jgi:hypothetical protein
VKDKNNKAPDVNISYINNLFDQNIPLTALYTHGGAVVEALGYKPEGRGIDYRWRH